MIRYRNRHTTTTKPDTSDRALYGIMNKQQHTTAPRTLGSTPDPHIAHIEYRGDPQPVDADIVIPIYNESATLSRSIRTLRDYLSTPQSEGMPFSWNIVIADNASTDATWPIAQRLHKEFPGTVRAVHISRKGRGYALKRTWGDSLARVMAYMDVDLSTDIRATPALIGTLLAGQADIAIGSRLSENSQVVRSSKREFISRSYNLMLRVYLGARFHDAQCGFKALTAQAARRLLDKIEDNEWFFDTELLMLAQDEGLRLAEIPVHWVEDTQSTVNIPDTVFKDLSGMARLHRKHVAMARTSSRINYHLSSRYSTLGWDALGQRELRGSLLEVANTPDTRKESPASVAPPASVEPSRPTKPSVSATPSFESGLPTSGATNQAKVNA